MTTYAVPPTVALDDDAQITAAIVGVPSIVHRDSGWPTVVLTCFDGEFTSVLCAHLTTTAAAKLRDALLTVVPLPDPDADAGEPGRESLGDGLVSVDTREWLGES